MCYDTGDANFPRPFKHVRSCIATFVRVCVYTGEHPACERETAKPTAVVVAEMSPVTQQHHVCASSSIILSCGIQTLSKGEEDRKSPNTALLLCLCPGLSLSSGASLYSSTIISCSQQYIGNVHDVQPGSVLLRHVHVRRS